MMKNKTWRDDDPTDRQISSIEKMSKELNIKSQKVKTKGEASDLILELKNKLRDLEDEMKNYFGW